MVLPDIISDIPAAGLSLEEFQEFAASHDGFWELDEGVPVRMESPSEEHQWISLEVASAFRDYLKGHPCRVLQELDVWTGRMPFNEASRKIKGSVRRPDILIYCNQEQRQNGVILSPQLVVEIWSPTNTNQEFRKKLKEYYRIGVKEYWQIDYKEPGFTILSFDGDAIRFTTDGSDFHKPLESAYFPGLKVDLSAYYTEFADTAAANQ